MPASPNLVAGTFFPELVANPEPVIAKLAELLPGRFTPGPAVAACVKPQLFSNRGG